MRPLTLRPPPAWPEGWPALQAAWFRPGSSPVPGALQAGDLGLCCPRKLRRRLAVAKSDRRVARQVRGQPIGGAECPPCQVGPPVLQKDESTHLIGDGAFRLEIDGLGEAGQSMEIGRAHV